LVAEPPEDRSGIFAWANLVGEEAVYQPDADPTLPPLLSDSARKLRGARSLAVKRSVYLAALGVVLLALAGGAAWWLFRTDKPVAEVTPATVAAAVDSKGSAAAGGQTVGPKVVSLHFPPTAPGKEFASLQEALLQAKPRSKIVVNSDLAESVTLEGTMGRDVTIEAAPGRTVYWRPPAAIAGARSPDHASVEARSADHSSVGARSPDHSSVGARSPDHAPCTLLHAINVSGLQIKGLHLDGQNRLASLITLTGRGPDLTLDPLALAILNASSIALHHCSGDFKNPITPRKLRVLQPPAAAGQAAIAFAPDAKGNAGGNQFVHVDDCRFEGALAAAIDLQAPAANIEVARNRFFQSKAGLRYRKADPLSELHVLLDGNTFCEVGTAVDFEALPPTDGSSWILAQNNLFVKTARISGVANFTGEPA